MRRPSRSICIWLGVMLVMAMLVVACRPAPPPPPPAPTKEGGTIKVAIIGNPPTLDVQKTTASVAIYTMWHVFETLFTHDQNYQPIPHLVDEWSISPDGLTYVFNLREGVPFHNGSIMTAEDVVASLNRWGVNHTWGRNLFSVTESLTALDEYTVELKLSEPVAIVPLYLTTSGASIMPKSVIEAAGDEHVSEFIGTGPYEFVEYQPDQHIKLKRFEDYAALPGGPRGYGGTRTAYLDEILFMPVPDVAVRIAGVQTGDYHFGEWIQPDEYERLLGMPEIETVIISTGSWTTAVFNRQKGIMSNRLMRQAVLAALDMEPIMKAAYGHEDFYRLAHGPMPEESIWYTDAGKEFYNQANVERAKELATQAGYAGEPIRWVTTTEYPAYYNSALVSASQLEAAGFKVDLQVVDWATVVQLRSNPDVQDVFSTAFGVSDDPVLGLWAGVTWPSPAVADQDPEFIDLMNQMRRESDFDVRYELWERAMEIYYDYMPMLKFGEYNLLHIHRPAVKDFAAMRTSFFWNVWLETK